MIANALGIKVSKQSEPTQGIQKKIPIDGLEKAVGFYNSFSPEAENNDQVKYQDTDNGRIMRMVGDRFESFQFHPESILSQDGYNIMKKGLERLLKNKSAKN